MFESDSESDQEDWFPLPQPNNLRSERIFRPRTNFNLPPQDNRARFRLHDAHIEILLERLAPIISHNTDRNFALTAEQQIRLALRYLATGDNFTTVGDSFGVHKSTVSRTLHRFLDAVRNTFVNELVTFPAGDAMQNAVEKYRDVAGIPSVIGCIDGTRVEIIGPAKHEDQYINRHGTYSINAMCVCGPTLRFYCVNANMPGCVNDSRVFRNSALRQQLEQGWRPWPNGVLLGDSGYANGDYLITPILNPQTPQEERFNRAHRKTRRYIECAFGVLKQRFRCLLRSMRLAPQKAGKVILVCVALHNLLINEEEVEAALNEHWGRSGQRHALTSPSSRHKSGNGSGRWW